MESVKQLADMAILVARSEKEAAQHELKVAQQMVAVATLKIKKSDHAIIRAIANASTITAAACDRATDPFWSQFDDEESACDTKKMARMVDLSAPSEDRCHYDDHLVMTFEIDPRASYAFTTVSMGGYDHQFFSTDTQFEVIARGKDYIIHFLDLDEAKRAKSCIQVKGCIDRCKFGQSHGIHSKIGSLSSRGYTSMVW
jgi:hypothetical protein